MKAYNEAREAEAIECESTGMSFKRSTICFCSIITFFLPNLGSSPCYIVIDRMPTDEQVRQIKKNTTYLRVSFL